MAGDERDGERSMVRAPRPDAFALKNSGLQAFLYAGVGTEPNGSTLTILSVLARLGNDPWAQAACWAAMPRAAAIDGLSHGIAQMPLVTDPLMGSRDIAERLVQLLPTNSRQVIPAEAGGTTPVRPNRQTAMMVWCGIVAWIGLTLMLGFKPATDDGKPARPSMAVASSVSNVAAPPTNQD
jgi:hypothetical protein